MTEFIGLAYFAEIPAVIVDVQRGGPSTGMPTRTQQSDLLACAYASHGDTKHVLLFPEDPRECFELTAKALAWAKTLPASPARDAFAKSEEPSKPAKKTPAKAKKQTDRPAIFVSWDKDKDGFLSKEEYIPHIADKGDAPARFVRFDKDKDGRLSKEEFVNAGN